MTAPNVILHLGLGSFHRAHQAVYLHQLRESGDVSWELAGANIRDDMHETIEALRASNGAYTLETISPAGQHEYMQITSIKRVFAFAPDLAEVIACGASETTRIVSFTVTEAGYYLDSQDKLDVARFPALAADIKAAKEGRLVPTGGTIYGALAAILRARRAAGSGPLTLLCCDNLRHNGERSRGGLLQFLLLAGDRDLHAWVEANTTSPNAMVDRITPRPTPAVRERVLKATQRDDPAALMGESFIQWVIEDRFAAGRPAWEKVGAELVASVDAYEEAKIRVLNATHSCIAWAGTLLGFQYIHQGTEHPAVRAMAFDYVTKDVIPVLDTPERPCPINLAEYRDVVLERFANPAIVDTNRRVAMDGFSKIPGFIAPTIRERLAQGAPIDSVAMLPALFLAYLQLWHQGRLSYEYDDQAVDPAVAHEICASPDPIASLCANEMLWGSDLTNSEQLIHAIRAAYQRVLDFVQDHGQPCSE